MEIAAWSICSKEPTWCILDSRERVSTGHLEPRDVQDVPRTLIVICTSVVRHLGLRRESFLERVGARLIL